MDKQFIKQLIQDIDDCSVDIEELFVSQYQHWQDYYLDELAVVIASSRLATASFFESSMYILIDDWSPMFGGKLPLLLHHTWLPKLAQAVEHSWDRQEEIFAILSRHSFLEAIKKEITAIVLPATAANATDPIAWAVFLECTLDETVDLVENALINAAPEIPEDVIHLRHSSHVVSICFQVWATTADAAALASIPLSQWKAVLQDTHISAIFAAALSCRWPLEEMVQRYLTVRGYVDELEVTPPLSRSLLYTLNSINAEMDRSGVWPILNAKVQRRTLSQVLQDWSMHNNVKCINDTTDKQLFVLRSSTVTIQVRVRDNIFWVDNKPIGLEKLAKYLI